MLAAFSELKQTKMCFTCQLLVRFRLDIICNSLHGLEWTIIVSSGSCAGFYQGPSLSKIVVDFFPVAKPS